MTDTVPEDRRRSAFAALLGLQDDGRGVPQSRKAVGDEFGLSPAAVERIEREGIAGLRHCSTSS